jgi:hypothetical protein
MADLTPLAWPAARLNEALEALARRADLSPRAVEFLSPPAELLQQGDEALGRWLRLAAEQVQTLDTFGRELEHFDRLRLR